ncbi:pre-toxin TG domain-containing protein [Streptomyces erythrochromogenes]|uniref:pre-toxin TG domain-containing protein n=1 Tax=Streptomyces erythrochromogenes TaxID=285574 RepID=UPI0036A6B106
MTDLECVEVRVPIRIRLLGRPTAEDLARLEAAVARLVARRADQAARALAGPGPRSLTDDLPEPLGGAAYQAPAARYEAGLDDAGLAPDATAGGAADGYRIMSYQGPPRPVRVPVARPGAARPADEAAGSPAAQQAALRRITELLDTGVLDWAVTDAEAREALRILRRLAPPDLMRVVQSMRLTGRWGELGRQLPADVDDDLIDLQQRMDPNSGYLMPGDTVRVELRLGARLQEDVSGEYVLGQGQLALPLLPRPLEITGLRPVDLPDRIARAYADAVIFLEPWVKVAVTARGPLYAPRHGPTRGLLWYASRRVERAPQEQAQLDKRRELISYVSWVRAEDELVRRALTRYYTWIEKHFRTSEFLRRTGPELWGAMLREASQPMAASARSRFLELAGAMQRTATVVPQTEKLTLNLALGDYLSWLDRQSEDSLTRYEPGRVWAHHYLRRTASAVRSEAAERLRRENKAAADAAAKVDWEAAGRKLDAALELMRTRLWRVREPYLVEDRDAGVGYLVWESAQSETARDLIARGFLHDVIASMHRKDFTATSVTVDFRAWLADHPVEYAAYLIAQAHPDVEQYEIKIDIPAWQTAIEVGIGFIPIVGSIVAAGEAAFGYDLFGNKLSTADRAILAASVLLPAAAKVFKGGRALVSVATLAREYRLSPQEAEAAYRALTQVRPGSAGARVLESAATDVKAGRPVRDAKRLGELENLLKDMGWTDRTTAGTLRAGAAESALHGRAGRTGQEAADLFATGDEAAELAGAIESRAQSPAVTGGKRPRIEDTAVSTKKRARVDIDHIARAAGETQRQALARAERVIGRRIDQTILGPVWERARSKVVGGRDLQNASRQKMFDLYDKVRDEFWTQARADNDVVRFLDEAGFEFPVTGKAPLLKVADPAPGLDLPKAADIGLQERRVSLDHNLEKALGENHRLALDANNLTFQLHNPNSNRETVQVKFGLRPTPGVTE